MASRFLKECKEEQARKRDGMLDNSTNKRGWGGGGEVHNAPVDYLLNGTSSKPPFTFYCLADKDVHIMTGGRASERTSGREELYFCFLFSLLDDRMTALNCVI